MECIFLSLYSMCAKLLQLYLTLTTLWTVAYRRLCPCNFPGKNTGVSCHGLIQGDLPHSGIEPTSLMSPALAGMFFTTSATWEAHLHVGPPSNHIWLNILSMACHCFTLSPVSLAAHSTLSLILKFLILLKLSFSKTEVLSTCNCIPFSISKS